MMDNLPRLPVRVLLGFLCLGASCSTGPSSISTQRVDPEIVEVSLPRIHPEGMPPLLWAEPNYRSRDLKKLRIGMSKAEVLALFQEPISIKRTPSDEYWEYDWFELYFRGGFLVNWFDL